MPGLGHVIMGQSNSCSTSETAKLREVSCPLANLDLRKRSLLLCPPFFPCTAMVSMARRAMVLMGQKEGAVAAGAGIPCNYETFACEMLS